MGLSLRRFESFPLRSCIPGQLLRIKPPRCLYSPSFREGSFSETRIHTPACLYGVGA